MENKELILKAVEYAKYNSDDTDITLRQVAAYAGFSLDYFNRMFLSHTGFTVMAYINYLRIKKAIQLLRTTDMTVLDIALSVGYDSHEGFIKAFKKYYEVSPSEYRRNKKDNALFLGEFSDTSCARMFLKENTDFELIDTEEAIDFLLDSDAKKYGYLCTLIKYNGYSVLAPKGNMSDGFVCIADDRNGGVYLELVTENISLLSDWLCRFNGATSFYINEEPDTVNRILKEAGISKNISAVPQSFYFGGQRLITLPDGISIRKLNANDKEAVLKWANGKKDGYIAHLLNENHYNDPNCLDYGVFEGDELIAAVGCGIDEVRGFRLNNCCYVRFAEGRENKSLYRIIFEYVINDIIDRGILPFDDIQHGKYADTHGGFTAAEVGFTTVNRRYSIEN